MTEPAPEEQTAKSELIDDKKSVDKLEIEDEERKKMLDCPKTEEDKEADKTPNGGDGKQARVQGGEVEKKKKALEEAAKAGGAGHRPIGGIKIPGFLRSSRKDRGKDGDEGEERADLLVETPCSEKVNSPTSPDDKEKGESSTTFPFPILNNLKFTVPVPPFLKRKRDQGDGGQEQPAQQEGAEEAAPRKPKLINAIRLPLASLVPKKLKSKEGDVEAGGQAGLASMETLDDSNGDVTKHQNQEDGMENIRLDSVEADPEKAALEDESESKWARKDWSKWWDIAKEHKLTVFGVLVFLILLIILIIAVISGPGVPTHAPIIDGKYIKAVTSCGYVEGLVEAEEYVFRGIPFAKPPLGDLRFQPPQPMTIDDCWNGTLKAHNVTPSCWQMFTNNSVDGSEDCLTLDVWTPYVRYDTPLPVLFLLGTDSLSGGWPSKLHVPAGLAKLKEVVIVRPRFRLSTLGFLAAQALSQTVYPRSSGNYGLADVIAALDWTRLNIAHFGGDPRSVTVLGYRAGATLGTLLTTIRRPEKLFARLWLSTGTTVFPNISLAESETESSGYLAALGCNTGDDRANAECLRRADVEDLLDNIPDTWKPAAEPSLPHGEAPGHQWLVNDGHNLRQHPHLTWAQTNLTVQVVIGTTIHSEISPEWYKARANWTADRIRDEVQRSQIGIEGHTNRVLAVYNHTLVGLAAIISDIATVCPLYSMHKLVPNSRFYLVTQVSPSSLAVVDGLASAFGVKTSSSVRTSITESDDAARNGLAYAGSDVEVIMGTYPYRTSPAQRRYITAVRNAFYRFALNGKAPEYRANVIGQDLSADKTDLDARCSLWKEIGFDKFAKVD